MAEICDDYQRINLQALIWTLISIAVVVVGLRLLVRIRYDHGLGWDDYTAVAALVSQAI